jgi:mRNA interferase MazF
MTSPRPSRGEVRLIQLDPVRGHEQGGTRPGVVVTTDPFNHGPAELHVILPITRTNRRIRWHIEVRSPEGGLRETSYIKCEDIRSVARDRFLERWGTVSDQTLDAIVDRLRLLLEL